MDGPDWLLLLLEEHELGKPGRSAARDAVDGVAWHAANTVPLVDIPKAWGWTEPWDTNPEALLPWSVGAVLFIEQAVVAVGLAEAITSRAIRGAAN